ncbi:coiled-coil domain-containing protein 112 isoform X1 [Pygocentrus nattereri]|uniref:coiled-coil domain-containing protein 112 isoform X1 n=2 Tax=Pygocentrus nattereri TaxID=42514 RepID=UPI000814916E|nr:coiled-coil domain-containing protein 112 isoform X1 [Pygocentrus nattereri]
MYYLVKGHHTALKMQSSDERVVLAKTADFLQKAEHLRKLADKHAKERKWNNCSRKNDLKDCFCSLEELENKFNSELKIEVIRVRQQLQKIRNSVYRFQGQLIDVKPSPDLIEKLKDIMSEIESSINTFKEEQHQSFEELLKEERTCWQEIWAFEKKIDAWSLTVKKGAEFYITPKVRLCMDKKGKEVLPAEVMALEAFLQQTGGKLGGWDQYDHQSFLKVWTKHHGKPSYRTEAKFYLPSKTEEDIRLHEDWYLELCRLQERKKEAIQKWRAERLREKEARLQDQESEAERREHEAAAAEAQRLKQEEERREAAARLETWRSQRKQQQEQEEEQRLREEILQRKQLKEERRRQLEVKLAIEAHIRQKKEEEELRLLEQEAQERAEMEERQRLAAEGIRRFQERDLHKLETKLQEKQAKEEEELERVKKQAKLKEKVESHITRDPSRLCKPTKGWKEHTKEIGPTGGGPVYQMFHRAVPAWRQGL